MAIIAPISNLHSIDFTIEAWVYLNATATGTPQIISTTYNLGGVQAGTFIFYVAASGVLAAQNNTIGVSGSTLVTANQWHHVAMTYRTSTTTIQIFLDGVSQGSVSAPISNSSSLYLAGSPGDNNIGSWWFTGYISNFRAVRNQLLYTGAFTPSTSPLTTTSVGSTGSGAASSITGTISLLTCQSNRFVDNSANNFTLSLSGTPSVQAFSPFAPSGAYTTTAVGGSGYFDGTGDYLSFASNAAFTVGTGDLTIEAWIYVTSLSQIYQGIISGRVQTSPNFPGLGLTIDNSQLLFTILNIGTGLRDTANVPLNQWVHVVGVRSGTNAALFVNGSRKASSTNSENGTSSDMVIGRYYPGTNDYYFSGYIAGARLLKGTAAYDPTQTSITIPTAPFTNVTNTSFLTNFTNAGITDATAKNVLETVGNAQISTTQSKFGGSSMSFDGTGDYLTSNPATTDLYAFGSGDFTIEMWLRLNSVTGTQVFYDQRPLAGGVYPTLYMSGSTLFYYTNGANRITGATLATGQWYHIAVSRSGTSTRLFVDGTQSGSTYTDTNVYLNAALRPFIGGDGTNLGTNGLNGYIDDLRITRGFARYTANFNVPTVAFPTQ
jgi:hypothetical protein